MYKRITWRAWYAAVLSVLLAACHPSAPLAPTMPAAPTKVPTLSARVMVVTEEWPPYNYTEEGQLTGVSTEIVKATLSKAAIEAEINVYPWARAYKTALEQENVLIYTIVRNAEREKL